MRLIREYFEQLFILSRKLSEIPTHVGYTPHEPVLTDIKLLAFYLPQFHPIHENDVFWEEGFTEWTNVTKCFPQFIGHYQPRLPVYLGFYDLRLVENIKKQVEIAKNYGIYGFVFHHYWFKGKKLLRTPIDLFLKHKEIDFKFCIHWANENWTRTWDGLDHEILIKQQHSPEDDIEFIKDCAKYFMDERYIRVKDKPMLVVYRPELFPNVKETAERWKNWCRKKGIAEDLYLLCVHSFKHINPEEFGFDCAVDYPPNTYPLTPRNSKYTIINPDYQGKIFEYDELIELSFSLKKVPYRKFRGICPSWDNESRRPGRGVVIHDSTPEKYKKWLKYLIKYTRENFPEEERFIFINAWNEWAEGAYLEPDRKHGFGYLEATYQALVESEIEGAKKIVFVGHDAYPHGAQILTLYFLKELKERFKYHVALILWKYDGKFIEEYSKVADMMYDGEQSWQKIRELGKKLFKEGFKKAICNTVVTGDAVFALKSCGFKVISLIHELPWLINQYKLSDKLKNIALHGDYFVFPARYNKLKIEQSFGIKFPEEKCVYRPQGCYYEKVIKQLKPEKEKIRKNVFEELKLPESTFMVLGVGYGDYRKGFDLFLEVASLAEKEKDSNFYFVWVGNLDLNSQKLLDNKYSHLSNLKVIPFADEVIRYYLASDLYLLSSREDPFPSTLIEALMCGLPVVAFKDSGGFVECLSEEVLVERENPEALYGKIKQIAKSKIGLNCLKNTFDFSFKNYVYDLLSLFGDRFFKVSVIIPNYNYAHYIKKRLDSILKQNYPIYEIIFLDDASNDKSVEIVKKYIEDIAPSVLEIDLIVNQQNSGSPYKQWINGLKRVNGEIIWIAEADDLCEETFLETVIEPFHLFEEVVLSYCQSKIIDEKDKIIADDYLHYLAFSSKYKWKKSYVNDGCNEIIHFLSIQNTIPNVSAVLFKKLDFEEKVLKNLARFEIAGDWYFYVKLLQKGKIAFIVDSLNLHRRHSQSVIHSKNKYRHIYEIKLMQRYVALNFDVPEIPKKRAKVYFDHCVKYLGV